MKKLLFFPAIIIAIISFSGCSKDEPSTPAASTNPYGGNNGQVTVWCSNVNTAVFPITIDIDGKYTGTIGGMTTSEPDCDASDNRVVKFVASPGTYNMYATSANGGNWTGSITVTNGNCKLLQLQ